MVKYKKFQRVEQCSAKGVDKANRDGTKLNVHDVHTLAAFIYRIGCDPMEFEKCVTVWLGNDSDTAEQVGWNSDMCGVSDLWPEFDEDAACHMTQTTLIGGHANYVNRCWYYGCRTDNEDLQDNHGRMSMDALRLKDPVWADAIERGSMTWVLQEAIRAEPDLLKAVIISDNIKQGANLREHSLSKLRRMWEFLRAETSMVNDAQSESILRKYQGTLGRQATDADVREARFFFNCARNLGDGNAMEKLSEFRSGYLTGGKERDTTPEFYGDCAQLPFHLAKTLFKAIA